MESTDGLSEVLTSEAIKTNSEWPFVTLSSFEVFVRHTRAQASSELIVVAPIVTAENLEEWANYSTLNQAWIDESFDAHRDEMRDDLSPIPSKVYRFGRYKGRTVLKPEDGAGGYPTAPFWQMSPPPFDTSIVNFNSLSTEVYQDMYDAVLRRHRWTMGMAGPNTLIDYTIAQEHHDALHSESSQLVQEEQERSSGGSNSTENVSGFANEHPHTAMMYPVYRELNNRDSDIVAMVVNILPWDNYLKNALPPGVNGVYCVLRNSMGQAFTYIINGNEASYLGEGDMHDRKYDDMEVIIDFNDFFEINDGAGVVVNDDSGSAGDYRYWFAVYPSEEMESVYQSNTPMTFALVTCSAFVVMTLTFILYDWFVIRKNNKILEAATRSDAILSVSAGAVFNLSCSSSSFETSPELTFHLFPLFAGAATHSSSRFFRKKSRIGFWKKRWKPKKPTRRTDLLLLPAKTISRSFSTEVTTMSTMTCSKPDQSLSFFRIPQYCSPTWWVSLLGRVHESLRPCLCFWRLFSAPSIRSPVDEWCIR